MKVLQFTDLHLFKNDSGRLCGLDTAASLAACVADAQSSTHWPPDAILVTGDITQDESDESYQRFLDQFESLDVPVFCLPGNHDIPAKMNDLLQTEVIHVERQFLTDTWQVLLLDSTVYKQDGGFLRQEELNFLEHCLSVHDDLHALVCLHHNAINVGSPWVDTMTLKNAQEFFAVLDKHANVKAVLTGHIHQECQQTHNQIPIYGTPATSIQFMPRTPRFQLDSRPPGYRWLELEDNGVINTQVQRLKQFDFVPDPKVTGY
jgi:Icc protein